MKIFLITGNTGFIGQNILNSNIFSNHKLILINRKKTFHKKKLFYNRHIELGLINIFKASL